MSTNINCLLCDGKKNEFMFLSKGYKIIKCNICNFCQVAIQPSDDELSRLYMNLHKDHSKYRNDTAAERENIARFNFVRKFILPGSKILDAGCSTGDFLSVAKEGYNVFGVDISSGAVDFAKSRLPDISNKIFSSSLEDINSQWGEFDAICLWDVIEHVKDPIAVLNGLFGLLKPGGILFFSTPDVDSLTAKIMRKNWAFMIPPLHLGFFSRKSIDYIFASKLPAKILEYRTKGKWTNLAFLFYKINQISRWLAPQFLLEWLGNSRLGDLNVYIPTNDIMYVSVKKQKIT